jgi:hypothetical protein
MYFSHSANSDDLKTVRLEDMNRKLSGLVEKYETVHLNVNAAGHLAVSYQWST